MAVIQWFIELLRDPGPAITWGGYPLMAIIIFVETGLLFALLPGDSLLVTAGIYAAAGKLDIWMINLILIPCAIAGDACSYLIGARSGDRLFSKPESRFFKPSHLQAAKAFYEKHGGKAIIIARFMPLVRTFVPVIAGMAKMSYPRFAMYNAVGGIAWITSMSFLGYFAGSLIPDVGKHVEKVIVVIVVLSILPGIIGWWRGRGRTPQVEAP